MRVAVLGAGVTGLTAAWKLSQAGHAVRVFEASNRVGGAIRTDRVDGWLVESGPHAFREDPPEVAALFDELGLDAERLSPRAEAAKRYLVRSGSLVAVPKPSLSGILATPLLSPLAKLRAAFEVARRPRVRSADLSLSDFVEQHFGAEIAERIAQPFVGGIFAGDAKRLSARYAFPKRWEAERVHGSLVRAAAAAARARRERGLSASPPIVSFRSGMQALPSALASKLPAEAIVFDAPVRQIGPGTARRWRVEGPGLPAGPSSEFDWVICALPADALASLAVGAGGCPLAQLQAIEYPPVASLFLGFRREQVGHPLDGFGALVPPAERIPFLGMIFDSSLFPGRAPQGHVAINLIAGGALRPEDARASAQALVEAVRSDLARLLRVRGEPVFVRHTLWRRAIPQYELGFGRFLDAMAHFEHAHPGLAIGGCVRDGISVGDCLASGVSLAQRVS